MELNTVEYTNLCHALDELSEQTDSKEYKICLEKLEQYAENYSVDAAEFLAELLAYNGEHHNAEKAYKWYFVAYSSQGYKTEFDDLNNIPPHYCGPIGDFRNESMVSDLVAELGFERVQELDNEIRNWVKKKST